MRPRNVVNFGVGSGGGSSKRWKWVSLVSLVEKLRWKWEVGVEVTWVRATLELEVPAALSLGWVDESAPPTM